MEILVNSHTHIGDAFIDIGDKNWKLDELVAPPHGFKHEMMRKASEGEIIEGMKKAISVMERCGTTHFIDFREGGVEGIKILKKAMGGSRLNAIILGRPLELRYDSEEVNGILRISEGIGVSSISDWDYEEAKAIAEHVASRKKILALHASEDKREDIGKILDLSPMFLIHLCKANEEDIKEVVRKGIGVVVCPRANAFFGLVPPVNILLEYKADIMLGTDNAMIVKPDIMEEKKYVMRKFGVSEEKANEMISATPEKLFGKFI